MHHFKVCFYICFINMEDKDVNHEVRFIDSWSNQVNDRASVGNSLATTLLNGKELHFEFLFQHHEVKSQRHESQEIAPAAITEREIAEGSSVAVNSVDEAKVTFRDVVSDDGDDDALHGVLVNDFIDGDGDGKNVSAEGDRLVLEEFFAAMGGPSWVRKDNWLSPLPLGHWYGITVDERGRVTGITLPNNCVTGMCVALIGWPQKYKTVKHSVVLPRSCDCNLILSRNLSLP